MRISVVRWSMRGCALLVVLVAVFASVSSFRHYDRFVRREDWLATRQPRMQAMPSAILTTRQWEQSAVLPPTVGAASGRTLLGTTVGPLLAAAVAMAVALREALAVRRSEARCEALLLNASDVVLLLRRDGTIAYCSSSLFNLTGYRPEELNGTSAFAFLHPDDLPQSVHAWSKVASGQQSCAPAEFRARHATGEWRYCESSLVDRSADPDVNGFVLNYRDITERKLMEEKLNRLAYKDGITGLPNRISFLADLEHALYGPQGTANVVTVMIISLNVLQRINDTWGFAMGEELLRAVVAQLSQSIPAGSLLARLDGDDFAILTRLEGATAALLLGRQIVALQATPLHVAGRDVQLLPAMGVALSRVGERQAEQLLREADMALTRTRSTNAHSVVLFDSEMAAASLRELQLEADLRRALDTDQLLLHFQPITDLNSGSLVEVEALIRWEHPEHGPIPPADFIPTAEKTGLIIPIGRWVLRQACRQGATWQHRSGQPPLEISVNLSTMQFQHAELVSDVADALHESGLPAQRLKLEITESAIMQDLPKAVEVMTHLKSLGVQLALDDFGTGYSSLGYLKHFPVDVLKIDRSFVQRCAEDAHDRAIVTTIITLAKTLNLTVTGEGIEDCRQLEELRRLGCDRGQGYLFARPLTSTLLERMFTSAS